MTIAGKLSVGDGVDLEHRNKMSVGLAIVQEKRALTENGGDKEPRPLLSAVTIELSRGGDPLDVEHDIEVRSDPEYDRPPPAKRRNSISSLYRGRSGSLSSDYEEGFPIVNAEGYERPHIKYAGMITQAIVSTSGARISLQEMYEWIRETYPYFQTASSSWMGSIRSNLVTNTGMFVKLTDRHCTSVWTVYPQTLLVFEEKHQIPQGTFNLLHGYIDRMIREGPENIPVPAESSWPIVRVCSSNASTTIMIRFAPASSSSFSSSTVSYSSSSNNNNAQSVFPFRPSQPVLLPSVIDTVVYDDPMLPASQMDDMLAVSFDEMINKDPETRTPSPQHLEGKLPEISPQKFHQGMEILPLDPKPIKKKSL